MTRALAPVPAPIQPQLQREAQPQPQLAKLLSCTEARWAKMPKSRNSEDSKDFTYLTYEPLVTRL